MSLDASLKAANSLIRHRNVLTRAERLTRLGEEEKWTPAKSVYGLPKVANRKQALAKAEKRFNELTGAGFIAAERTAAGESRRIKSFNPAAEETLFFPRLVGG